MKKFCLLRFVNCHSSVGLIFIVCLLAISPLFAQKPIPELWGLRVHDEAKVLSQNTIDQLEQQLKKYEDSTTNQIAILILPTLGGDALEEYSMRVAEKWKLGSKKNDNGVLLLIATDDHKMRIDVGQGLEGVLTDAQSNQIIRNEIAPNLRRGDYDAGVTAAIDAIIKTIGGEYKANGVENENGTEMTLTTRILIGLFVFAILAVFTVFALFSGGCAGWGLYAFLLPFYAIFSVIILGTAAGIGLFIFYAVVMPIAKVIIGRTAWGKSKMIKSQSGSGSSGSGWSLGSGWGSSSGFSSGGGGGFSGGGGSFGGGGSSGSW